MGIGGIGYGWINWYSDLFLSYFFLYSYIKRKPESTASSRYCSNYTIWNSSPLFFPFLFSSSLGNHTHLLHPLHCKCSSTFSLASSSLQWLTCCFIPSPTSSLLNSELSFHALGAFQLLLFFFFPLSPSPSPSRSCCCPTILLRLRLLPSADGLRRYR